MSAKTEFVQHFRHARTQHIKWINQIKLMTSGINQAALPLNQTESEFGTWLFDKAMMLYSTSSKRMIDEITAIHTECYDHYLQIYHILHKDGGLLQGLFGLGKKASSYELQLAQRYYQTLIERSDALISRLRQLESYLLAAPESEFESMLAPAQTPYKPIQSPRSAPKGVNYYRGQRIE